MCVKKKKEVCHISEEFFFCYHLSLPDMNERGVCHIPTSSCTPLTIVLVNDGV